MGFGLLFIGYFMVSVASLNPLGGVFSLAGFVMIIFAAKKLMQYNRSFLLLLVSSAVMALLSVVMAVGDVGAILYNYLLIGAPIFSEATAGIIDNIRSVADLAYTAVLCICVRNIAKETGAEKIEYLSMRNLVFFSVSFAIQALVWLSGILDNEALLNFVTKTALPIWSILVYLICQLLICWMLFSCYAKICDVNDTEMSQKPSRFAFVNRRREISEARHKQYLEEAEKYNEEQKRRSEVTNKKRKKRK